MSNQKHIKELSFCELKQWLKDRDFPAYHAGQIFSWVYKRQALEFGAMSDLPEVLREKLQEAFFVSSLRLCKQQESQDATKKFLFELCDAHHVEAVLIPTPTRITGCISTQVGCKFACTFCASGGSGFKRNLSVGEMLDEVSFLKAASKNQKLSHIVFMGTGEPLDNYASVMSALRIINAPEAFAIGARRITISTSGLIPQIERLADEQLQFELSVSLHAADERTRSSIMPVNKKYPLKELILACRAYAQKTRRQVTFEYVLIKGLNSSLQNAQKLATIVKEWNCKINLIPANPVSEFKIEPPDRFEIMKFKEYLTRSGVPVTLRKARGEDIDAACGQLRLRYEKQ